MHREKTHMYYTAKPIFPPCIFYIIYIVYFSLKIKWRKISTKFKILHRVIVIIEMGYNNTL